jgi:peptide/nickel transport system ATP-binding protein
MGFAVLFITHDLSLLVEFSDRSRSCTRRHRRGGERIELFDSPAHPYTAGLMASFPPLTGDRRIMTGIPGNPPDLANPPTGCRFHPRCPSARREPCHIDMPALRTVGSSDHRVACHFPGEVS